MFELIILAAVIVALVALFDLAALHLGVDSRVDGADPRLSGSLLR
jgi:hypothetical protein